jgi:DNA-binding MarR family transcriptional regulator
MTVAPAPAPAHAPDLDALAADLTTAIGRLLRRLRAEANPSELALSQMSALSRLEQNGPMATAELARVEAMKPQSMGVILASLEEEGLVERRPHPTDRRQVLFALTAVGAAVRARHHAAKRSWLVGVLAELDPAALKTLAAAIPIVDRIGAS